MLSRNSCFAAEQGVDAVGDAIKAAQTNSLAANVEESRGIMRPGCFYANRHLIRYIDAEADHRMTKRIENHLLVCGPCRQKLLDLRAGRKMAELLPEAEPGNGPWLALESALDSQKATPPRESPLNRLIPYRPVISSVLLLAVGAALMAAVLLVIPGKRDARNPNASRAALKFNAKGFRQIAIDDISRSDDPHVVAEGYVANVSLDSDDGDLTFKLVDNLDQPGPFVVCEIMDPATLAPPVVGARIRVYGVSRFDAKADHQWYEVHPVLDIEPASK